MKKSHNSNFTFSSFLRTIFLKKFLYFSVHLASDLKSAIEEQVNKDGCVPDILWFMNAGFNSKWGKEKRRGHDEVYDYGT